MHFQNFHKHIRLIYLVNDVNNVDFSLEKEIIFIRYFAIQYDHLSAIYFVIDLICIPILTIIPAGSFY
jgi:hypothetical protein